jgi:hypothetical protein
MGCIASVKTDIPVFEILEKDNVSILLSHNRKCKSCEKGFGHSFASVSMCQTCTSVFHTHCVKDKNQCLICVPLIKMK